MKDQTHRLLGDGASSGSPLPLLGDPHPNIYQARSCSPGASIPRIPQVTPSMAPAPRTAPQQVLAEAEVLADRNKAVSASQGHADLALATCP